MPVTGRASSYPGIDFQQCMILDVGRSRTGGGLVFASLLGGLACLGGAGYMVWRGIQSRPAAKTKRRRAARSKCRSIDPPDELDEPVQP